jgi:hypothetical protein
MKLKLIEKFHESLHSMSIRGHYIKHVNLQKRVEKIEKKQADRFPMLVKRLAMLESDVKALKMEHDILYANSLKTDE